MVEGNTLLFLDMKVTVLIPCRLAALYIVDRLKSEVITSAITHYQHIAVLQARRNIIKRILNRQKVKHPDHHKVCWHAFLPDQGPMQMEASPEGWPGGGGGMGGWGGGWIEPAHIALSHLPKVHTVKWRDADKCVDLAQVFLYCFAPWLCLIFSV